ncbi:carcinoembryonic antigen-related cell adhesion molecule 1-like [Peromyscus eremicus]|uniref:carcinoembryonic antigen-related cell adhesion molecule 1-like n=1 Tax=Peromyscus eremicus TaxID=42410 RepID=UPI0027DD91EB|nr:carcinoembryonic antigen-related cell adhesion molecule 1-like [Peromyscus eremicus]
MELTSAPLHKAQVFWRGLLLTASLVPYWTSPTTAQVTVEAVPSHVAEGDNVLLLVHNLPATAPFFHWYKGKNVDQRNEIARLVISRGKIEPGTVYSGREIIFPNGSLFFLNVTQKDAGVYLLRVTMKNFDEEKASVQFHVEASLVTYGTSINTDKVTVEVVPSHIAEGDNVLLLVHNLPATAPFFHWYKGKNVDQRNEIARLVIPRRKLERGPVYSGRETLYPKGSLFFQNVTQKDAGVYLLRVTMKNFDEKKASVQFKVHPNSPKTWGISIRWLFNGQNLGLMNRIKLSQNNSTLSIDPVRREDSGVYQWEVSNPVSSKRSDPIQLDIIDPLTPPSIQVTNNTFKGMISVFLNCLSNDTGISVHWLFKGQSVELTDRMKLSHNNSTLQIDSVRIEDSGDYQYEVSNQVSSKRSDPIQLDIIQPVIKPSIQFTNTTVKDLTSVFLKCLSDDPGISIHWLFKGQSLRITNRMKLSPNNSTLEIVPARSSHSGDYQCEVSNQVSSKRSDPIQVNITDPLTPPSIQVTKNTVKVLSSVFLNCLSNDTGISIHWLFKGQSLELTDRMKLSQNNSTLQIDSVRIEDSGDYQCEVSNQISSKRSDPMQLDILQPVIKPSIQFINTTVKDLTSVFLKCLSNDTGISIHWLFKGQSLRITNRMKLSPNNSTLEIVPARSLHSGDYQCEVSNPVSSKRSDLIQLDIIDPLTPPSIQVTNNTFKGMTSVFLNCFSNNTGISVHWLFKGQSVELTDRMKLSQNNSTLQIDSVRIEDSGEYQCEVSNQVSSKRSDPIQLDIIREHRLSLRSIIGIIAQCVMGLIAVIFVLVFLWRRRRRREPQIENNVKQVDNKPMNLNETSKASSNVKPQKEKKPAPHSNLLQGKAFPTD